MAPGRARIFAAVFEAARSNLSDGRDSQRRESGPVERLEEHLELDVQV